MSCCRCNSLLDAVRVCCSCLLNIYELNIAQLQAPPTACQVRLTSYDMCLVVPLLRGAGHVAPGSLWSSHVSEGNTTLATCCELNIDVLLPLSHVVWCVLTGVVPPGHISWQMFAVAVLCLLGLSAGQNVWMHAGHTGGKPVADKPATSIASIPAEVMSCTRCEVCWPPSLSDVLLCTLGGLIPARHGLFEAAAASQVC